MKIFKHFIILFVFTSSALANGFTDSHDSTKSYAHPSFVLYNDEPYRTLKAVPVNTLITNTEYWVSLKTEASQQTLPQGETPPETDTSQLTNSVPNNDTPLVAPSFSVGSTDAVNYQENGSSSVYTADATGALSYSISSGDDIGLFEINSATGVLTFKSSPDFESPTDQGSNNNYSVTITATNSAGTAELSLSVVVTDDTSDNSVTDDPDLPNAGSTDVVLRGISTAGYVSSSSKLSGGFTITGGSMSILATGKGAKEYLSTGLLQDTLSNPTMSLLSLGNSSPLFTNNDWVSGAHVNELTATNFFGNYESDDSGLYISLNEGSYLADISSSDGDDGGCLVEVYNNYGFFDATYGAAKLTGISTNGIVNSGSEPGQRMSAAINIGNFGTDASATKRIIVMAKWSMGVTSDHLEDPRLEVRDGTGTVIATNDDWSNNNQSVKSAISSTGLMGGYRDKDAALILNVTPGFYFMDVYSQDGDSGGSLVEVYDLDLLESVYGWSIGN